MILLHGRYHIFSTFKYIKYGLLLCLVPLLKALLVFNLNAFFVALRQDAFILVCIAVVSLCLWRSSRYTLTRLELCCESGILVKKITHFKLDTITAIEIKRPLILRLLGGSDVYVYFKSSYPVKSLKICIPYKSAERLVDEILPVKSDKIHYQPSGWDKFIFVMLSANIVTTSFFVIYTVKRISKFLGMNVEQIAMQQLNHMEQIFSFLLPAGFTMLISIISFFVFISLAFSVFNAYGFSVARSRNIIISRGGFISKVERRLRLDCITYTDVHVSPFARLLKSYPVFVCAGGYKGNEMPLFVYKKGETANIRKILPEFTICSNLHLGGNLRYHFTFLWLPLTLVALLVALLVVAIRNVPELYIPIVFLLVLALIYLAASINAAFKEGFTTAHNRTLYLQANRIFTMHLVCVYTHDIMLYTSQSSFSASNGRCNLIVKLPGSHRFTVRSVARYAAKDLPFLL